MRNVFGVNGTDWEHCPGRGFQRFSKAISGWINQCDNFKNPRFNGFSASWRTVGTRLDRSCQEYGGWGTVGQIYEIKSVYSIPLAEFKVDLYVSILNAFDKKRTWIAGISYFPEKTVIDLPNGQFAILGRPAPGVVSYCVVDVREVSLIVTAALAGITVELGAAA